MLSATVSPATRRLQARIAVGQRVDRAFVLQTGPLGDADLIVTLLTERSGRVRGVARAARSSRRRFGGALEPLTEVRASWSEKAGRELHRLDSLEPIRSHAPLQAEPALQATCAALAEIGGLFAHEGQPDPDGYRLMSAVLAALETGSAPWMALRYFEYWTLRLQGLLPDLAHCVGCGKPLTPALSRHVRLGDGAHCGACRSAGGGREVRLGRAELEFLGAASRKSPAEMPDPGRAVERRALERFLRGTIESYVERPLRAYRHLRRLDEGRRP